MVSSMDDGARDHQFGDASGLQLLQDRLAVERRIGGEEDELLALLRVGHGDDGAGHVGKGGIVFDFDERERHHLAADLGEALGAADGW